MDGDTDYGLTGFDPCEIIARSDFESDYFIRLVDVTNGATIIETTSPLSGNGGALLYGHRYTPFGSIEQRGIPIEIDSNLSLDFSDASFVVPEPGTLALLA